MILIHNKYIFKIKNKNIKKFLENLRRKSILIFNINEVNKELLINIFFNKYIEKCIIFYNDETEILKSEKFFYINEIL